MTAIGQPRYIATAFVQDVWAGTLAAYLVPFKTTRRGQRMIAYRWITDRGSPCDGMRHGMGARYMIDHAIHSYKFTDVAVMLAAREKVTP